MPQGTSLATRSQVIARAKPPGWPKHVACQTRPTQRAAPRVPGNGDVVTRIEATAPGQRAEKVVAAEAAGQGAAVTAADSPASAGHIHHPAAAVGQYGAFFDWLFNQR